MELPLTERLVQSIANRGADLVKQEASKRGWSDIDTVVEPYVSNGQARLRFGRAYLVYVEQGTEPRLMKELEGRVIPLNGKFVRVKGVGEPGFVTLPGGVKVWREQKWRHPGIKPAHIFRDSLKRAQIEAKPAIKAELIAILTGEPSESS